MALGRSITGAVPLDGVASVETPEHVEFRYQVAGPLRRALAWAIDLGVRIVLFGALAILASLGSAGGIELFEGFKMGLLLLALFFFEWGYFVLSEMLMDGRTLGKRALGLRVVTRAGLPIGFGDSVLRNLLRAADFLPFAYALGVICMALDGQFRRLGDLVSGTLVVFEARERMRDDVRIVPPPTPQELATLPERVMLSSDEIEALELFLRRAPELTTLRAHELAELVAPVLAARHGARYTDPTRFLALLYAKATWARR